MATTYSIKKFNHGKFDKKYISLFKEDKYINFKETLSFNYADRNLYYSALINKLKTELKSNSDLLNFSKKIGSNPTDFLDKMIRLKIKLFIENNDMFKILNNNIYTSKISSIKSLKEFINVNQNLIDSNDDDTFKTFELINLTLHFNENNILNKVSTREKFEEIIDSEFNRRMDTINKEFNISVNKDNLISKAISKSNEDLNNNIKLIPVGTNENKKDAVIVAEKKIVKRYLNQSFFTEIINTYTSKDNGRFLTIDFKDYKPIIEKLEIDLYELNFFVNKFCLAYFPSDKNSTTFDAMTKEIDEIREFVALNYNFNVELFYDDLCKKINEINTKKIRSIEGLSFLISDVEINKNGNSIKVNINFITDKLFKFSTETNTFYVSIKISDTIEEWKNRKKFYDIVTNKLNEKGEANLTNELTNYQSRTKSLKSINKILMTKNFTEKIGQMLNNRGITSYIFNSAKKDNDFVVYTIKKDNESIIKNKEEFISKAVKENNKTSNVKDIPKEVIFIANNGELKVDKNSKDVNNKKEIKNNEFTFTFTINNNSQDMLTDLMQTISKNIIKNISNNNDKKISITIKYE